MQASSRLVPGFPSNLASSRVARLALMTLLLGACAGCTDAPQDDAAGDGQGDPKGDPAAGPFDLEGSVLDLARRPIAGATVTVRATGQSTQADASGQFRIADLPPAIHIVDAAATGYHAQTLTLSAPDNATTARLDFVLTPMPTDTQRNFTQEFQGRLECGFEAVILPGSCDVLLAAGNDGLNESGAGRPLPEPFLDTSRFDFFVEPGWKTLVIDVVYDGAANPGVEALRMTFQGQSNTSDLGTYEQYGRWSGAQPYTARIEPGGLYEDGVAPVPANATLFRAAFYPQGHGWHAACLPEELPYECFLGVGAGLDIEFEVLVTAFYGEPAPEGWTLLDGA